MFLASAIRTCCATVGGAGQRIIQTCPNVVGSRLSRVDEAGVEGVSVRAGDPTLWVAGLHGALALCALWLVDGVPRPGEAGVDGRHA